MKKVLAVLLMLKTLRHVALFVIVLVFLIAMQTTSVSAQVMVQKGPLVFYDYKHDTSRPAAEMLGGRDDRAEPLPHRRPGHEHRDGALDDVLQSSAPPFVGTTNGANFGGIAATGFAPPDTSASVGATQVVETVNVSYEVFDKSTRASVLGPVSIGNLWRGFGGVCETGNLSDPVVLYDKEAGRWVIAIVAFSSSFNSNAECIAVSTTSDATGSYNRYGLSFGSDLNDYTKLAVWPDAYYLSANIFPGGGAFLGPGVCALDRTAMLAGTTASVQCFLLSSSEASLLPSDLDGSTAPPAGSPNFFMELGTSNTLNLFKFHVDFANSTNTILTGPIAITVPSYTDACGGSGGTCIPQPGTGQQLDTLGDRLMFRLAYRNFGSHEALVASHSITSGSSTGVRWYEIRSPNATPVLFQSGTFAPDASSRWMPSIAMDKAGDIAVGYSVSSASVFPSIAYTGRVPTDTLGTMESETTILAGSGSQTGGLSRWGDYTSMAIDPSDDCTFLYSNEYLPTTGSNNWATQLAAFRFPSCGSSAPDFTLAATPSSQSATQGNSTTYTATVGAVNGFSGTVTFSASGLPTGAGASFNPISVSGSGSSTMTLTTASTTPPGTHTVTITGTSGSTVHSSNVSLTVNQAPTPDFSLSRSPTSVTITQGGSGTSSITITQLNGFTGNVTLSASGLPSGVTPTFSPNPATTSSTLTFTASSSATTGTATVTITGSSGSLTHTTTITLTVNAAASGNFSLSASPNSVSVRRGSTATSTITITRTSGFRGQVTFSAPGLPSGVQATFSANPTATSSSTLTFTASSTATVGTFTVTVRGSSGSLAHTTTIRLTVSRFGG